MKRLLIIFSLSLLLLSACEKKNPSPSPTPSSNPNMPFDQTQAPKSGETIAVLKTSKGVIKMKFFPEFAPETVRNFLTLSQRGFYDGLLFHRVIPDFMIQGGDPKGDGTGGETYKGPGTTLPNEVVPQLNHVHGAVSMANRGNPITGTSQFFIVQNKNGVAFLNGGYTVFAQVFEGLDVVDAIVNVPRDDNDKPKTSVKIEKVTIEHYKE